MDGSSTNHRILLRNRCDSRRKFQSTDPTATRSPLARLPAGKFRSQRSDAGRSAPKLTQNCCAAKLCVAVVALHLFTLFSTNRVCSGMVCSGIPWQATVTVRPQQSGQPLVAGSDSRLNANSATPQQEQDPVGPGSTIGLTSQEQPPNAGSAASPAASSPTPNLPEIPGAVIPAGGNPPPGQTEPEEQSVEGADIEITVNPYGMIRMSSEDLDALDRMEEIARRWKKDRTARPQPIQVIPITNVPVARMKRMIESLSGMSKSTAPAALPQPPIQSDDPLAMLIGSPAESDSSSSSSSKSGKFEGAVRFETEPRLNELIVIGATGNDLRYIKSIIQGFDRKRGEAIDLIDLNFIELKNRDVEEIRDIVLTTFPELVKDGRNGAFAPGMPGTVAANPNAGGNQNRNPNRGGGGGGGANPGGGAPPAETAGADESFPVAYISADAYCKCLVVNGPYSTYQKVAAFCEGLDRTPPKRTFITMQANLKDPSVLRMLPLINDKFKIVDFEDLGLSDSEPSAPAETPRRSP